MLKGRTGLSGVNWCVFTVCLTVCVILWCNHMPRQICLREGIDLMACVFHLRPCQPPPSPAPSSPPEACLLLLSVTNNSHSLSVTPVHCHRDRGRTAAGCDRRPLLVSYQEKEILLGSASENDLHSRQGHSKVGHLLRITPLWYPCLLELMVCFYSFYNIILDGTETVSNPVAS